MAYVTKKNQMRYIELGNFVVDFNDNDVLVLDNVKDISPLYPLKPMTTLIAICCKGWQAISCDGDTQKISEGDVLISPPNMHVSGKERSEDFDSKVICLSDNLIRSLLRDKVDVWHRAVYVNRVKIINIPVICKQEFGYYFAIIRSKLKHNNPSAPHEIMFALLRALLLELCFLLESANSITHEQKLSQGKVLFNRFLSLISNSEVKRQPISVYAGQLAITPKYLTMLCLKYSNKTASEWVAQYTVEEIRFFLKGTDLSIKEISARLGFSNMSHFGSYVRKHLGMSPSEFRFSKKG